MFKVLSTIKRVLAAASIMFWPDLFLTSNITTDSEFSLAKVVDSFSLKLTVAISFNKIGLLFSDFTTNFSRSLGEVISPIIRNVFLCPPSTKFPADMDILPFWIEPITS